MVLHVYSAFNTQFPATEINLASKEMFLFSYILFNDLTNCTSISSYILTHFYFPSYVKICSR